MRLVILESGLNSSFTLLSHHDLGMRLTNAADYGPLKMVAVGAESRDGVCTSFFVSNVQRIESASETLFSCDIIEHEVHALIIASPGELAAAR